MRRVVLHSIAIAYICISLTGVLYTMFRIRIPVLWPLQRFSYETMAPFQKYAVANQSLVAEGLSKGGTWVDIPLKAYMPYHNGEEYIRARLMTFQAQGEDVRDRQYVKLAGHIQRLEQGNGRDYKRVRLILEQWPKSPNGREADRKPELTERTFLGKTL